MTGYFKCSIEFLYPHFFKNKGVLLLLLLLLLLIV